MNIVFVVNVILGTTWYSDCSMMESSFADSNEAELNSNGIGNVLNGLAVLKWIV